MKLLKLNIYLFTTPFLILFFIYLAFTTYILVADASDLAQEEKTDIVEVGGGVQTQSLLCSDLPEFIENVEISVSGFYYSNIPFSVSLRNLSSYAGRKISDIGFSGNVAEQTDVLLKYETPVDVAALCNGHTSLYLDVESLSNEPTSPPVTTYNLYGSTANSYIGGFLLNSNPDNDAYFILNLPPPVITLSASNDAFSTTYAPGEPRGNQEYLRVQDVNKITHKYKHIHRGFVQVDISTLPIDFDVATATARLYVSEVSKAGPVDVQLVTENWNETTLSMDNIPDVDFALVTTIDVDEEDVGTYVEFDLTSEMIDWLANPTSSNGIMLSPRGTAVEFGSKESNQSFEVVIEYISN